MFEQPYKSKFEMNKTCGERATRQRNTAAKLSILDTKP